MIRAVADTHAVIWYIFGDHRLSDAARATIEDAAMAGNQVAFSSITLAEIVYLAERNRIHPATLDRLLNAAESTDAVLLEIPFDRDIARAPQQVNPSQVPELADRIVAATAAYLGVPIISRDREIRQADVDTIW